MNKSFKNRWSWVSLSVINGRFTGKKEVSILHGLLKSHRSFDVPNQKDQYTFDRKQKRRQAGKLKTSSDENLMSSNIYPFEGSFPVDSRSIFTRSGTLLVTDRPSNKLTRSKSEQYLLLIPPDGKRKYISSLWPRSSGYEFEYNRIRYFLTIGKEVATITRQIIPHVSHRELFPQSEKTEGQTTDGKREGGEV